MQKNSFVDFKALSDADLLRAIKNINREKFPENFSSAIAEATDRGIYPQKPQPPVTFPLTHPWRRCFAKTNDWLLVGYTMGIIEVVFGLELLSEMDYRLVPALVAIVTVPYEIFLLKTFGTTIGKRSFGIYIHDSGSTSLLNFRQATKRTLYCLIYGAGFNLAIFGIVAQIIAYFRLKKNGRSSWDQAASAEVIHSKIPVWGIALTFVLYAIAVATEIYNRHLELTGGSS